MREDKNMGIMITLKKPTLERWPRRGPRGPQRGIHAARQEVAHTREQKRMQYAYARTCWQHGSMWSACRGALQEPPQY